MDANGERKYGQRPGDRAPKPVSHDIPLKMLIHFGHATATGCVFSRA